MKDIAKLNSSTSIQGFPITSARVIIAVNPSLIHSEAMAKIFPSRTGIKIFFFLAQMPILRLLHSPPLTESGLRADTPLIAIQLLVQYYIYVQGYKVLALVQFTSPVNAPRITVSLFFKKLFIPTRRNGGESMGKSKMWIFVYRLVSMSFLCTSLCMYGAHMSKESQRDNCQLVIFIPEG